MSLYWLVSPESGGWESASRQEVPPQRRKCPAMAAPCRRWISGLLSVLKSHPIYRPLQNGVPRDVLLFQHERGRFFAILGLFCASQGIFWTSLAIAALSRPLIRTPADTPSRGYMDLRSALWRYGLAVGCGTMGKGVSYMLLWVC